ncbi:MAG: signal peptidase I [Candidatus Chisholmbacteria bacterium]|nr:signal peptidase I [Candidatus Chisholmbacteria bacterium]
MKMRKILSISFQVVLFAVMAAGGALFVAGHLGYSVPIKPYVVMSGSMEPAIPLGSVVFVKPKPFGYAQGDIITFITGKDLPVTHRVNDLAQDGEDQEILYQTKGDANKSVDQGLVHKDDIIGAVTLSVPYVGYAVDFAKKPQGFIFLVIVPATIIIYEELKNLGREIKRGLGRLRLWLRRRRDVSVAFKINLLPKKEPRGLPLATTVVPFLGALFVTMAVSGSFFLDSETSLANVFGAASSFDDIAQTLVMWSIFGIV